MVEESKGSVLPIAPDLTSQEPNNHSRYIKEMRDKFFLRESIENVQTREVDFLISNLVRKRKDFETHMFSGEKEAYEMGAIFLSEDVSAAIYHSGREAAFPYNEELSAFFISFVSENLGGIESAMNQFGTNVRNSSFHLIDEAADLANEGNHRKKFVDFCIRGLNGSKETISSYALSTVIKFASNVDFYNKVLKRLPSWVDKWLGGVNYEAESICSSLGLDCIPYSRLEQITREICYARKIDADKLLVAWAQTCTDRKSLSKNQLKYDDRALNLAAILVLEKKNPGITKDLMDSFGILDFGRYALRVLTSQEIEKEETDLPYGIVIYPRSDYNGAFYDVSGYLSHIYEEFSSLPDAKRPRIRVFEVENVKDLASVLNKSRKKWGKISFAIIAGHGTQSTIEFGEEEDKAVLVKRDLFRKGAGAIKKAFVDNPTIILDSCSTGSLGGIASAMSEIGGDIIAPDIPTAISKVETKVDEKGKIDFQVKYAEGSAMKHSKGLPAKIS